MDYIPLHDFNLTEDKMLQIQNQLRNFVKIKPLKKIPKYISGVDAIYSKEFSLAVIITFDYASKNILECTYAITKITFDYKPGLLAFHELPAFLKAWTNLSIEPDVVVFDGYGYAHPRRVGLATHASFFIQKPTIGIAKKPFIGTYHKISNFLEKFSYLADNDEIIGAVLQTNPINKPIFISIGNNITLEESMQIVNNFTLLTSRIPLLTAIPDRMTKILKKVCFQS